MTTETRIVGGSAWMLAMRWTMRLIGLVSTLILARLLTPEDFGLVAMGAIVLGLLQTLSDAGVDLALLRDRGSTPAHWNTAWTVQVFQGLAVMAMLLLAAVPAATFFDEPRITPVLLVLALTPLIAGFTNIGIVAFRRDLNFASEFRYSVFSKLSVFAVVIPLAFLLRSYWALIIGNVAGAVIAVAISYAMHEYRPKFTLEKIREIWGFSQWLLVSRIGMFGARNSDKFIIGGASGTATMGDYHLAKEIGPMMSNEIIAPIKRALFPNFAILLDEKQSFVKHVSLLLAYVAFAILPIQFGLSAVASEFVPLFLGPKWVGIVPLVEILALAGAATAMVLALEFLLPVTNNARQAALVAWLEVIVLVPVLIYALRTGGVQMLAIGRLVVAAVFVPIMFLFVARACQIPVLSLLNSMWRPLVAALAMYFSVVWLKNAIDLGPAWQLIAGIGVGAVIYPLVLILLWWLSGKPPGVETDLLSRVQRLGA